MKLQLDTNFKFIKYDVKKKSQTIKNSYYIYPHSGKMPDAITVTYTRNSDNSH